MADAISSDVAKLLTHVEATVREETVGKLREYLMAREQVTGDIPDVEIQKLWKVLYYCFWLTDKVGNQQEMASVLAELGTQSFTRPENVHRYFTNFFVILRMEWTKMDYLRLDKFYSLIRRMLKEWLLFLSTNRWNVEQISSWALLFREEVLLPFQADGLRLHLSFIFLEELAKVKGGCDLPDAKLREMLSPFFCMLVAPPTDLIFQCTMKDVFSRLDDEFEDGKRFSKLDRKDMGQALFSIAEEVETMTPSHRKILYALAMKKFGFSGTSTPTKKTSVVPEKENEEEEEEEPVIPVVNKRVRSAGKVVATPKAIPHAMDLEVEVVSKVDVTPPKQGAKKTRKEEEVVSVAAKQEEEEAKDPVPVSNSNKKKAKKAKIANEEETPVVVQKVPIVEAPPPVLVEEVKKKVSFSHFETAGIRQITKRMQDTPRRPASDFGKPAKGLLKPVPARVMKNFDATSPSSLVDKKQSKKAQRN